MLSPPHRGLVGPAGYEPFQTPRQLRRELELGRWFDQHGHPPPASLRKQVVTRFLTG
jgi:hypothetical protein